MTTATPPTKTDRERGPTSWVTPLLVASAMGVYLLVIVGAATSLLEGVVACPTWPACSGRWIVPLDDPALAAAWGHRVSTVLIGGILLGTAYVTWRRATKRVRYAIGITTVLYPVQIVLGAVTATSGAPVSLTAVHLTVAIVIFSGLLVALLWHLEAETDVVPSVPTGADPSPSRAVKEPSTMAEANDTTGRRPLGFAVERARTYLRLTKPKLMWLLCLVALAAMGLAAGPALSPRPVVATLTGGVLAIGASGTFNNVLERDRDRYMNRTADRPLVQGRISVHRAVAFGLVLAVGSIATFVAFVNVLAAALSLLAILFYSVVYTLILKPHTTQNIVIGGAVGAFPALIGWAAVTNTVGMPAVVLGLVIFLWTPAHFYNLALAYENDYERAAFPMLPVVAGEATTRRHILLYLGSTLVAAVLLGAVTRLEWIYAVTAVLVGGVFLWAVVRLFRERTEQAAFRSFHASNAYLGVLLVAIVMDSLVI